MTSVLLAAFAALAIASGIAMEVLRQRVIVPAIEEQSSYSVGISAFTLYAEAREYRDHCRRAEVSPRWWRLWWAAHVGFVFALLGVAATWGLMLTAPGAA